MDLCHTMIILGDTIDRGHRLVAIQDCGHEHFVISMTVHFQGISRAVRGIN